MTKKYDSKNQIWFEESAESVQIGFTKSFLETLDQCWHILPSNTDKFKLKAPLLTVETNDALISIMSPVAGNFMHYSDKAQNFPDRLTEEDVIMQLSFGQVARPQVARARVFDEQGQANFDAPPAPPAQLRGNNPVHQVGDLEWLRQHQNAALRGAVADAPPIRPFNRNDRIEIDVPAPAAPRRGNI